MKLEIGKWFCVMHVNSLKVHCFGKRLEHEPFDGLTFIGDEHNWVLGSF